MNARDLLNKMEEAEDRFLRSSFVAPVVRGGGVQVRVAGIVLRLAVTPAEFEGWAVLKPVDQCRARVVAGAKLSQVKEYLAVFPRVRLVLCEKRAAGWWGISAGDADRRFRLEGPVPVLLAEDVQTFDTVRTRWDGTRFLFESRDPGRDPSVPAYLRKSLEARAEPASLVRPTLTPQERMAYEWQHLLAVENLRDATEERLRQAVAHADGRFESFIERRDHYAVTFLVDGQPHTTTIGKEDLAVMVAGICLSGEDEKFDLASLVGVIREGQNGRIVRVGDDGALDVEEYRQAHPPRRRR
jgi:hypothetical protein